MPRPSNDDRESFDRAFADLVAGYHLTADRPDPMPTRGAGEGSGLDSNAAPATRDLPTVAGEAAPTTESTPLRIDSLRIDPSAPVPRSDWADQHPLFRFEAPPTVEEPEAVEEHFVPAPPPPLPRPAWPVLAAWIAMGYAILAVLAASLGVDLPRWAAWAALFGFVGGFGVLVTRLPRHRPPDAGDGAVL